MRRDESPTEASSDRRVPLCPECGYAFDRYVDRLLDEGPAEKLPTVCPVCGCGECNVAKP